jgi:hypothetical protein
MASLEMFRLLPTTPRNISKRICCIIAPVFPTWSLAGRTLGQVLRWAAGPLGAHFILGEAFVRSRKRRCCGAQCCRQEAWPVGAFHLVTTMTGSALLALALKNGVLDDAQVCRRACGRGLEQREMGRGRRGRGPPRVEVQGFRGRPRVLKALVTL